MNELLQEDGSDKKVWIEPEKVENEELEKRGKRLDELDIEILEEERELRKLEEELKYLEITPLTIELERKLELMKSLVREERMEDLKRMVKERLV